MYKLQNIIKKYISNNNINIVIDFLNNNNIKNLIFYNENIIPLNFYNENQIGGKDDSVFIDTYIDKNKLFKSQSKMTKNELLQIIHYTKFDKNKDKNILNYINNIVILRLKENNNLINEFLNNIINDSLIYQEQINKNELSKIKDDVIYLSSACELLDNILMVIYLKCGYYKYTEKTFELNLQNNKIIQDYKNKLKLKIN
jgi:hypothetical protein